MMLKDQLTEEEAKDQFLLMVLCTLKKAGSLSVPVLLFKNLLATYEYSLPPHMRVFDLEDIGNYLLMLETEGYLTITDRMLGIMEAGERRAIACEKFLDDAHAKYMAKMRGGENGGKICRC